MKKEAVRSFLLRNTCGLPGIPYNAPPLTRNNDLRVTGSEVQEAESPEKNFPKRS
jgi:hypothetical protein